MGPDLCEEKLKFRQFPSFKFASHEHYGEGPLWGQQVLVLPFPPFCVLYHPTLHPSMVALFLPCGSPVPLQAIHLLQTKHF